MTVFVGGNAYVSVEEEIICFFLLRINFFGRIVVCRSLELSSLFDNGGACCILVIGIISLQELYESVLVCRVLIFLCF